MALTNEDLQTLARPFRFADHSFLRGFVYLSEEAITARIEEVDTSWGWAILDSRVENNRSVYTGRLTINGVSKDGVGMQKIDDVGESDKGASTDALKRAARLFGVGRYLLGAPKGSGDEASPAFKTWLAEQQKAAGVGVPTAAPANASPAPAERPQQGNVTDAADKFKATYSGKAPVGRENKPVVRDWKTVFAAVRDFYAEEDDENAKAHWWNGTVKKLEKDGVITDAMKDNEVIKAITRYKQQQAADAQFAAIPGAFN